ncbi:Uma2 family endonuclease [Nostocaceae cyanobacterium CENA369]|uniref:Uma2 family endonuclease n=1 Tax=Dendronalium phyllosphericum CENA369 TaxID=1725256 RepID=A0A8J7I457_9NOST|nr:Uma2 family endonuclease [Dendronalium phyllosphericum]MBH8573383.1 Uma2 family endonuclease [Dendronalium phyllosphericum CENA369]
MYQTDPPRPAKEALPTMYDLPSEDPEQPGLPDEFHAFQPQLLRETFSPPDYPADQVFVASDLNLYYDPQHTLWYKRPDWFAAVGVSRLYEQRDLRLSYVIWQEGVAPFVVVELLSPGTEKEDLGKTLREISQPPTKWEVYERILRVPYYIVFDRYTDKLQAFQLVADRYSDLNLSTPQIWMPSLQLGLGLWQGYYQGIERLWLRWYDADGNWLPTPVEQESQRAEKLAAKLRELGFDPNQ